MKKKMKIVGLEEALKNIPEEERAEAEAAIKKVFENFDPENPPGQPIVPISANASACPRCGGKLVEDAIAHGQRFSRCESCDTPFSQKIDA